MIPHFIRGLYDGDGTISRIDSPVFTICSAVNKFLEDISDIFEKELLINKTKIFKPNGDGSNVWRLTYQSTPAIKIRNWIYDNALVYMDCKKNRFYSYDESVFRSQDINWHNNIIDKKKIEIFGWKRLSDYKGYKEHIIYKCSNGHINQLKY